MKKLLSVLFCMVLTLSVAPVTSLANTQDDFGTLVERSFNGNYEANQVGTMTATLDGSQLMTVTVEGESTRYSNDAKAHGDYEISFNMAPITTYEPNLPPVAGDFTVGFDMFYEDTETLLWGRIRDLSLNIVQTPETATIKDMAEGYFELVKFLQNNYVAINYQELVNMFASSANPQISMMAEQFKQSIEIMRDPGKLMHDLIDIAIDSNLMMIERNGSTYTLMPHNDPSALDVEVLLTAVDLFGYPEPLNSEIKRELERNTEEITMVWQTIQPLLEGEIRFLVSNGAIVFITTDMTIEISEETVPAEMVTADMPELLITFDARTSITNDSMRISFPRPEVIIDLTKFYRAIKATMEMVMVNVPTNFEVETETIEDDMM
jgi:hypothetical protein